MNDWFQRIRGKATPPTSGTSGKREPGQANGWEEKLALNAEELAKGVRRAADNVAFLRAVAASEALELVTLDLGTPATGQGPFLLVMGESGAVALARWAQPLLAQALWNTAGDRRDGNCFGVAAATVAAMSVSAGGVQVGRTPGWRERSRPVRGLSQTRAELPLPRVLGRARL